MEKMMFEVKTFNDNEEVNTWKIAGVNKDLAIQTFEVLHPSEFVFVCKYLFSFKA